MNSKMKAIKEKIKSVGKKVVDSGANYIEKRVMLKPSLDVAKGEQADLKREMIKARRERISENI